MPELPSPAFDRAPHLCSQPPNPRLQRTPAASPPSPLSRKPFGDSKCGQGSAGRLGRSVVFRYGLILATVVMAAAASRCTGRGGQEAQARKTIVSMRAIGSAVEAYAVDHGRYPSPPGSIVTRWSASPESGGSPSPAAWPVLPSQRAAGLRPLLEPRYIEKLTAQDGWGNPILYATTADGRAYSIVSPGRDGRLDGGRSFPSGPIWDPDRDLLYADGFLFTFQQ